MPIDNCNHDFSHLATRILPDYFLSLKRALAAPLQAQTFVGHRSATKVLLGSINKQNDFPGCYVFMDQQDAIYVGISRKVINRIVQHLNLTSHYSASLVYQMAARDCPQRFKRDHAMRDDVFLKAFASAQERLRRMSVAFIEIRNDLELYLFEVFAAMKLNTHKWNTFRTH